MYAVKSMTLVNIMLSKKKVKRLLYDSTHMKYAEQANT